MDYYNNDYLQHYGVLGMKWGVRRARRKEAKAAYRKADNIAKQNRLEANYQKAHKQAKAAYKTAKKDKSRDVEIANKLYSKQSKETNKRVVQTSTGKALAQSSLMGSYGALKYNEAKSRGASRGKAAVVGILFNNANIISSGLLSTGQYLDNRMARK